MQHSTELKPYTIVDRQVFSVLEEEYITVSNAGMRISVQTPTHYRGDLEFAGGAMGTMIRRFDIGGSNSSLGLENHGRESSLFLPDPNYRNGEVKVSRQGNEG